MSVNTTKKTPLFLSHMTKAQTLCTSVLRECVHGMRHRGQPTDNQWRRHWVDSSTPLLPEGFPGTDAELVSFLGRGRASVKKEANLPIPMDVQAQKSFLPQA